MIKLRLPEKPFASRRDCLQGTCRKLSSHNKVKISVGGCGRTYRREEISNEGKALHTFQSFCISTKKGNKHWRKIPNTILSAVARGGFQIKWCHACSQMNFFVSLVGIKGACLTQLPESQMSNVFCFF